MRSCGVVLWSRGRVPVTCPRCVVPVVLAVPVSVAHVVFARRPRCARRSGSLRCLWVRPCFGCDALPRAPPRNHTNGRREQDQTGTTKKRFLRIALARATHYTPQAPRDHTTRTAGTQAQAPGRATHRGQTHHAGHAGHTTSI